MARWHKDMGEETQEKQKMFSFYLNLKVLHQIEYSFLTMSFICVYGDTQERFLTA